MTVARYIASLEAQADLVEQYLGRPVGGMSDASRVTEALIRRSAEVGAPKDEALDARVAIGATAAAIWRRSGGSRFVISDSVAASLVLTKQPTSECKLPLPAFLIQIPAGYMPSSVEGRFEGTLLVVSVDNAHAFVQCYVYRGSHDGVVTTVVTPLDMDEDRLQVVLENQSEGGPNRGQAAKMTARIIRNLAAWVEAFPPTSSPKSPSSHGPDVPIGRSDIENGIVHLRTNVKLSREAREIAQSLVHGRATTAVKTLAMRHIVRGHWKHQACGSDRKLIYIAPYWRGPDSATAWGRTYQVI